jgi:hypothetical protein
MIQLSPVRIVDLKPRAFAGVRGRLPVAEVPRRFPEFLDKVYAQRGALSLDGQNIFTYRPTDSDDVVDAEFGVGVLESFAPVGDVVPMQVPTGMAAMTTLTGDYAGIRSAHQAVIDWCKAKGQQRTGVRWEIYGHWGDDPSKVETHIYHQVRA